MRLSDDIHRASSQLWASIFSTLRYLIGKYCNKKRLARFGKVLGTSSEDDVLLRMTDEIIDSQKRFETIVYRTISRSTSQANHQIMTDVQELSSFLPALQEQEQAQARSEELVKLLNKQKQNTSEQLERLGKLLQNMYEQIATNLTTVNPTLAHVNSMPKSTGVSRTLAGENDRGWIRNFHVPDSKLTSYRLEARGTRKQNRHVLYPCETN